MLVLRQGEYIGALRSTTSANGVLIGITEYQAEKGFCPLHSHENPHLSFVLKGKMSVKRKWLSTSDPVVEPYSFMRAGEVHQNAIHSAQCKNMNLELESEFFDRYGLGEGDITPGLIRDRPGTALLMVRLYKELLHSDGHLADSIHVLLLEAACGWKIDTQHLPPWVNTVRELLNDRWNQDVSLYEVARTAGVHPVTVSRYFIRYFGTGFGEYRRRLKVERAISMIGAGISLTEVSYACGFFDQSHFIRVFKDFTAISPKDLKKV